MLSYTNFGESSLLLEDVGGEVVVPFPLTELYDVKYKEYPQDELVEQAEQLFQSIVITNKQALILKEKTRGQSSSPEWYEQRHVHQFFMMYGQGKILVIQTTLYGVFCVVVQI